MKTFDKTYINTIAMQRSPLHELPRQKTTPNPRSRFALSQFLNGLGWAEFLFARKLRTRARTRGARIANPANPARIWNLVPNFKFLNDPWRKGRSRKREDKSQNKPPLHSSPRRLTPINPCILSSPTIRASLGLTPSLATCGNGLPYLFHRKVASVEAYIPTLCYVCRVKATFGV